MRQELVYIPRHDGPDPTRKRSALCPVKPKRVWTLFDQMEEPDNPPTLPIVPRHNVNAFIEDRIHDWDVHDGRIVYYSRVTPGGCWLLLEFEE